MKRDDLISLAREKRAEMNRAAAVIPVAKTIYNIIAKRYASAPATVKKLFPDITEMIDSLRKVLEDCNEDS